MEVEEVLFILKGPLRSFEVDFLKVRVICANHENSVVWDEVELGEESLALNSGWPLSLCIIPFLLCLDSPLLHTDVVMRDKNKIT
eukprot:snap_masked-scaffold_52-processed-gene-1.50-mRNA-1 protein AED:1.00 eAED:1.00 QI:0/0/0/0/1/1/4/0/84